MKQQSDLCNQVGNCSLLAGCLLSLVFDLEDNLRLRNVDKCLADYMASHPHTHGRENLKSLGNITTETWSSRFGVGRRAVELFEESIVAKCEVKTGWSYSDKSDRPFYGRLWHKKKRCFAAAADDGDDTVLCSHCRNLFSTE